ncbi:MAG: family 16 glycoside hydrolase [Opitutaceae bacterium]
MHPMIACRTALIAAVLLVSVRAQSSLPPEPVGLDTLAAFRTVTANWQLAGDLAGDPRRDKTLATAPGTGVLVCNPGTTKETRGHLLTAWEHGDLELDLEFLLTPGSNSGVYLQGRYEVQLFDSWGKRDATVSDCGAIYQRWDAARGAGKETYDGHAPLANACRAPGLWQTLHLEFQAPRFDAAGKKTKNARFTKVVLNGFTVQQDVEVTGPTRSSIANDEKPLGPLMIQGDHGSVALRGLAVKRFESHATLAVSNLRYKLFAGSYSTVGSYDKETPKAEGALDRFSHDAVTKDGRFALTITGNFEAPRAGAYRFATEASGASRLLIDGNPVVVPVDRSSQAGIVTLTAGKHAFRLDLVHGTNSRPALELFAEGPGIAPHALTVRDDNAAPSPKGPKGGKAGAKKASAASKKTVVEPKDRVLLQRGFVPFDPRKRLYAASVGSPTGVHFAYDFETATILRAWRGSFIDTSAMWDGRGNDQTAVANGPALTFHDKPTIAFIEYPSGGGWPDQPDALWSSRGYSLEADGTPVFLGKLADVDVRDRIAALPDGHGLSRRLELKGKTASWSAWVLLAESTSITPQPGGKGWIIGEREWFIDWPANAPQQPIIRSLNGKQQLAVALTTANLEKPIAYSIVW